MDRKNFVNQGALSSVTVNLMTKKGDIDRQGSQKSRLGFVLYFSKELVYKHK